MSGVQGQQDAQLDDYGAPLTEEDISFSHAMSRANTLAREVEALVSGCFAEGFARHTYSERKLCDILREMVSPEVRLGSAHGSMGEVVAACLHLLHFRTLRQPQQQKAEEEDDTLPERMHSTFHSHATPAAFYSLAQEGQAAAPPAGVPGGVVFKESPGGDVGSETNGLSGASRPPAGTPDDSFYVGVARRHLSPGEMAEVARILEEDVVELCHPQYLIPSLMSVISPHQEPFMGQRFWYHSHVADVMDKALLKPGGVLVLINTLLTDVPPHELTAYQKVVRAVAKVPRCIHSSEEFVRKISPQILRLWSQAPAWKVPHIAAAVPMLLLEMSKRFGPFFKGYIFNPVAAPLICHGAHTIESLRRQQHGGGALKGETLSTVEKACGSIERRVAGFANGVSVPVFSGEDLVVCVETLHRVVHEYRSKSTVFSLFGNVVLPLLGFYTMIYTSVLSCKSAVFEILTTVLKSDEQKSRTLLRAYLLEASDAALQGGNAARDLASTAHFFFAPAESGGVELRYGTEPLQGRNGATPSSAPGNSFQNLMRDAATAGSVEATCDLGVIVERRIDSVAEILIYLAQKRESSLAGDVLSDVLGTGEIQTDASAIVPLRLCLVLCQKLGASCLKSGGQAATLILYLVRAGDSRPPEGPIPETPSEKEEREEDALQSLTTGLTLLELAMTDRLMVSASRQTLQRIRDALADTRCGEPEIAQMVATCRIGMTRLIERLDKEEGAAAPDTQASPPPHGGGEEVKEGSAGGSHAASLQQAMSDLASSDPGSIGHGLISLAQLVSRAEAREEVLRDFTAILEAFVAYLSHDESFIFLSAGKGLAALCDGFPAEAIPALTERYRPHREGGDSSRGRGTSSSVRKARRQQAWRAAAPPGAARQQARDHRLRDEAQEVDRVAKLADVLCYSVIRGGIGRLAAGVLGALLERCHYAQEEVVRASALQSIATVCINSPMEVVPVLDTVVCMAFDVLHLDKSPLCRRGAASILYHLFTGLGVRAVDILEKYIPKMFELARDNMHGGDPVVGEYFRLLLEEGNSLRQNLHGAPQQSLFSAPDNAF